MDRHIATSISLIIIAVTTLILIALNADLGNPISTRPSTYPNCTTEDGGPILPCYWDAKTQGNGKGDSFIIESDGTIFYTK